MAIIDRSLSIPPTPIPVAPPRRDARERRGADSPRLAGAPREPVTAASGEALIRDLRRGDVAALARYFADLSERTRFLFGPHPFTDEEAAKICEELDNDRLKRYVVDLSGRIIGYFLLRPGIHGSDADRYRSYGVDCADAAGFAPSVCDEFQGRRVGSGAFAVIRGTAAAAGVRRLVLMGGVRAVNIPAQAYYRALGFQVAGRFEWQGDNLDMLVELT